MNDVSPIRDESMVREVKKAARQIGLRAYLMVLLGLNTGLRISDLLEVTAGEIRTRGYIVRREKKTGKQTEIRMNPAVVAEIRRLTSDYADDMPLVYSTSVKRRGKSVTRETAYNWVRKACRMAGMREPVGCHTLRKTYGYHYYLQYRDIVTLMLHFNHSSERVTLRYIGITQEQINHKTEKFRL